MLKPLVLLVALLTPQLAVAGAWLRDKGDVFLSISQERHDDGRTNEQYSKAYLEYGFSSRFTIGAELSQSAAYGDLSGLLFMRTPLWKLGNGHHLSAEFGAGYAKRGDLIEPVTRNVIAWGRGFESRFGHGWANIDLTMEQWVISQETAYKADLTLGTNFRKKFKFILQLQGGDYPSSLPYLRLSPSMTYQLRQGAYLEFGLRKGLQNDKSQGLKIGTWLEF